MGYAVLKSFHLLGIVVWVGGMFFTIACLRPAAAALEPPVRVGLMRDALGRFLDIVVVAAAVVLLSGVWMLATASRVSVNAGIGFNMPIDWHVMVTLGVVMMAIFVYIRFALFRQLDISATAREWKAAAAALARIRLLVLVNLALAVVIIVVTRIGSAG
ncbi:MAG: CopD family protein [Caldimonas sp.]